MVLQWLSPSDVRQKGLQYCSGAQYNRCSIETRTKHFRSLYGSSHLDLASLWYDLTQTDIPGARLEQDENTETGFKMFLAANYFLWTYPKNSRLLSTQFSICERHCRGAPLWKWIGKIAAMKESTIKWDPRLDSPGHETFIITVDGTDCRLQEVKHPTLPVDKSYYSHKFRRGAVKYEVALSIFTAKCVWISGPHRGAKHDLTIFREGLKAQIQPGKLVIADRGYTSSRPDERMLSIPNPMDSEELNNFKSRARLRQETFNGRLKNFKCLSETFCQGENKHKLAFEAVCVIVQYQMDNGSKIFDV